MKTDAVSNVGARRAVPLPATSLVVVEEVDAAARAVAVKIGYQLPADSTEPDLICRDIASNMRRSVESVLEIGRALTVLKQVCGHGEFLKRIDALGIEPRLSQRFMLSAMKFSNATTSSHLLPKIESTSKLFELLVLDDEQVDELTEKGQTGELKLDDIACMSVSELRKSLREMRSKASAKDTVIANNQQTISKLQEQLAEREAEPSAEEEDAPARISLQAATEALDKATLAAVGHAGPGMMAAIAQLYDDAGEEYPDTLHTLVATALRRVFAALVDVADRYDVGLVSQAGEPFPLEPADIDLAEMESLKAAARADDNEDIIDVE